MLRKSGPGKRGRLTPGLADRIRIRLACREKLETEPKMDTFETHAALWLKSIATQDRHIRNVQTAQL